MIKQRTEIRFSSVLIYSLLLNAGSAFLWPLVTVYMHNYLHKSLTLAGVTLFLMSMFMVLGNYVGGLLFDRWSPYKTAIISVLTSTIGIVTLIFAHDWPIFGIMLMFVGFGDGACLTLLNSYSATIKSRSTRTVFNILYMGTNLGVVIGTLLVGFLLAKGVTVVFTVAAIFYLILFFITIVDFNVKFDRTAGEKKSAGRVKGKLNSLVLLICFVVLTLYMAYALWESVLSVHMTSLGISFEKYSLLWTLNGIMIVLLQPIANRVGSHFKLSSQTYVGVALFGLSFLALSFAKEYSAFVIVMITTTLGEIIGFPGIPAWIDTLSTPEQRGTYQGMFNVFVSAGRAIGPVYGGLLLQHSTYQVLFTSSAALIMIFLVLLMIKNKRSTKQLKS
ncbi:MDR family MFS transporter [Lentilactobacillus senioris]|uniref:Major facilitator superfamily protein n=1 Tax=Lentilactobacillus senioris DSM 24302 = JCM 17472 TaxID=1423802 RepID=A0A0R2CP42_9LACO|nr:MFS transporter [Lentilactobacillus senioris]KRM93352.1 major facilitator superfamily protein [Lentilactobacillus senioris DSM 24302 = JCM 17472]